MTNIKALITMLVLGSSSVAMADSSFTASAGASFHLRTPAPAPRPVVVRPAPVFVSYESPVRDHRAVQYQDVRYDRYDRYDRDVRSDGYAGGSYGRNDARILNLTGDYSGTFGSMTLTQRGNRVFGRYVAGGGGTIDGQIMSDGTVLFNWKNDGVGPRGKGVWFLNQRNNQIDGTWGTGSSLTDGGDWDLVRNR